MTSSFGVTTTTIVVGTGLFAGITSTANQIRTTISSVAGGTLYMFGTGITTGTGSPGITTGALIPAIGIQIEGPTGYYLGALSATTTFSVIKELSAGFDR